MNALPPPEPAQSLRLDVTERTLRFAGKLFACFAIAYAVVDWHDSPDPRIYANCVLPVCVLIVALVCALRIIRSNHLLILSPFPWFFLAGAAYCGIGPLVYHGGNEQTLWFTHSFFEVTEDELLRTNLLDNLSLTIVCFTSAAVLRRLPPISVERRRLEVAPLLRLAVFFAVVGLPIKYFVTLPSYFHVLDYNPPGAVQMMALFTSLAVFTLFFLRARGEFQFGFWSTTFIVSEIAVSVLTFSKMESLITILMIFLGWYIGRPKLVYFFAAGVVGLVAYLFLAPFVLQMRDQLDDSPSDAQGYEARVVLLSRYLFDSDSSLHEASLRGGGEGVQIWWFRLNYAPTQQFAMNEYDNGRPGETFKQVLAAVVPRPLWPDKPAISTGREFNAMITGDDESSSGPTVFGEAYWNGGWLLVIIICIYLGTLFSAFTWYSVRAMGRYDFRWLPCAFFGVFMGGRIDDLFVLTYVGMVTLFGVYYLFISRVVFPRWDAPAAIPAA